MIVPRVLLSIGLIVAGGLAAEARCPEPADLGRGITVTGGRSRTELWRANDGTIHSKLISEGRPVLETVSADGLLPQSRTSLVDPDTTFGFTYPHGPGPLPLVGGQTLTYEAVTRIGGWLLATETRDTVTLTVEDPGRSVTIGGCGYEAVTIAEKVVPGALGFVGTEPAPAPTTSRLALIPTLHLAVGLDSAGEPGWGLVLGVR